jgi:SPX domain protein involved in polyphosphate accumulation
VSKRQPKNGLNQSPHDNKATKEIKNIEFPFSAMEIGRYFKYPFGIVCVKYNELSKEAFLSMVNAFDFNIL